MIPRLRHILTMPPRIIAHKLVNRAEATLGGAIRRALDVGRSTYLHGPNPPPLPPLMAPIAPESFLPWAGTSLALADLHLEHRFDLLGSGWVQVRHGSAPRGLEGYAFPAGPTVTPDPAGAWLQGRLNTSNLQAAQQLWAQVEPSYIPIDWQLDFKSGYRWRETTWYRDIRYGDHLGADVKVPWELSRMQHLPILAYAYAAALGKHPAARSPLVYLMEFQNQVLDFLATNPPRYGVNWSCTMDVAIRAANLVTAFELFRALGAEFPPAFIQSLGGAIRSHGLHCFENLEYEPDFRNNHYLADVAGLLWAAAWLPDDAQSAGWLAFALQELVAETGSQFHKDGGNFEGSTSYHRLSAEMVLDCALLTLSLSPAKRRSASLASLPFRPSRPRLRPPPERLYDLLSPDPFPDWFWARLRAALRFTVEITRPDGRIVQVGDNDNGRFLKLWPEMRPMLVGEAKAAFINLRGYSELPDSATHWEEEVLDHRALIESGSLILGPGGPLASPEAVVIRSLLERCPTLAFRQGGLPPAQAAGDGPPPSLEVFRTKFGEPRVTCFPRKDPGLPVKAVQFPEFGLYIFRSERMFACLRAGSIGQGGRGGHAHNDQLGIDLVIDGEVLLQDPGTYLYTPVPEARNYFRSARAHALPGCPGPKSGPGVPPAGLFNFMALPVATCTHFSGDAFAGELPHSARIVLVDAENVSIFDFGTPPAQENLFHSPKYGALCPVKPTMIDTYPAWDKGHLSLPNN